MSICPYFDVFTFLVGALSEAFRRKALRSIWKLIEKVKMVLKKVLLKLEIIRASGERGLKRLLLQV